jgi:hypothetical protein
VRAEVIDIASDTELRVGYCLGVAEAFQGDKIFDDVVFGSPEGDPLRDATRDFHLQMNERIERLRGYLRARGLSVGARSLVAVTGVVAAKKRGEMDVTQQSTTISRCTAKCTGPNFAFSQQCSDDCQQEDAASRAVLRCRDDDPLPY